MGVGVGGFLSLPRSFTGGAAQSVFSNEDLKWSAFDLFSALRASVLCVDRKQCAVRLIWATTQPWAPGLVTKTTQHWLDTLGETSVPVVGVTATTAVSLSVVCSTPLVIFRGFIRSQLPVVNCRLRCLLLLIAKPHIQESSSCNIKYRNEQKQLWVFVLHTLIRSCTAVYFFPVAVLMKPLNIGVPVTTPCCYGIC